MLFASTRKELPRALSRLHSLLILVPVSPLFLSRTLSHTLKPMLSLYYTLTEKTLGFKCFSHSNPEPCEKTLEFKCSKTLEFECL